ncbi:MAG: hypothetical protein RL368_2028 [Pseudomonadota bacterium]|jgi:hypothetical protein
MLTCPNCKATHIVKYGKTRLGTQNYKYRECGRRFVEHPTKKYISQETWAQIDKWLQRYVNRLYEKQRLEPQPVKKGKLCLECDEMWLAVCYTNFWEAYKKVLPSKRHKAVGKETGRTNHIERFNYTLRQRVSCLVRKTLSFSKKLESHIGAIIYGSAQIVMIV